MSRTIFHRTCGLLVVLAFSSLLAAPGFGAFSSDDRGTTTASFLKLGAGARAMAMGEAYTAVSDDATALYWNPAGLMRLPSNGGAATFMHAPYVESTFYDYGGLAQGLGNAGAWGADVQYFSAGKLTQTDRTGNDLGSFTPSDFSAGLGYAHDLFGGGLGLKAKFIHSEILDSASAVAADIGYMTPGLLSDRLRLGFVAQNLGTQMKFHDVKEDLPLTLKAGSALELTDHWLTALDVIFPKDNGPAVAVGTEYRIPFGSDFSLAGRAGFNSRTVGGLSGLTGVSFGVGFLFKHLGLDYGFLPMGDLGFTHRISLSLRWGSEDRAQPTASLRSSRQASTRRESCQDIYGTANCKNLDPAREERVQPGNPVPSPRPW